MSGLYIHEVSEDTIIAGLFGASVGTVKNLDVEGGYIYAETTETADYNLIWAAGIVAWNRGAVSNCSFSGTVISNAWTKDDSVGGICGFSDGLVSRCYNTGRIVGWSAAGIGGDNISQCANFGHIMGGGYAGGIAGYVSGSISDCYNLGVIDGNRYVGGIAAELGSGEINNCYSASQVAQAESAGNIVGYVADYSIDCISVGNCVYQEGDQNGVGYGPDSTKRATEAEMKSIDTYIGWDFDELWSISPDINGGYPYLQWQEGMLSDVPVNSVKLSETTLSLAEGDYAYLTATVSPVNASDQSITWASSNISVATVTAAGKVTAVSAGTADITVTTTDGGYIATGTVTVTERKPEEYKINNIKVREYDGTLLASIPTGTCLASVSITNLASEGDALVLLASYTAEGRYQGLMWVTVGDLPVGATIEVTLPIDNSEGTVAQLKAFTVASFSNPSPLGAAVSFPSGTVTQRITLTRYWPRSGATDYVPKYDYCTAVFSQEIDPGRCPTAQMQNHTTGESFVLQTQRGSTDHTCLLVLFNGLLEDGCEYTVTIPANSVYGMDGSVYGEEIVYTFSTPEPDVSVEKVTGEVWAILPTTGAEGTLWISNAMGAIMESEGFTYVVKDAKGNPRTQVNYVLEAIETGDVAALMILPMSVDMLKDAVIAAQQAGIAVAYLGGEPTDYTVAGCVHNAYEVTGMFAVQAAEHWAANSGANVPKNANGKYEVAIDTYYDIADGVHRSNAIKGTVNSSEILELVSETSAYGQENSLTVAYNNAQDVLDTNPNCHIFVAYTAEQALGMADAIADYCEQTGADLADYCVVACYADDTTFFGMYETALTDPGSSAIKGYATHGDLPVPLSSLADTVGASAEALAAFSEELNPGIPFVIPPLLTGEHLADILLSACGFEEYVFESGSGNTWYEMITATNICGFESSWTWEEENPAIEYKVSDYVE